MSAARGAADRAMDRAAAAFAAGRLEEASRLCDEILRQQGTHFYALHLASVLALRQAGWEAAVALATRALAVRPGHPEVLANRGAALRVLGRYDEALADYDAALASDPRSALAHNNRGVALGALGRHEEALEAYAQALALVPDYVDAHYNRGVSLAALNRHGEAIEACSRALVLEPRHARARFNRAISELTLGDFASGLADYEWRHAGAEPPRPLRKFDVPRWHAAQPSQGATILVHAEQGLGDAIQFARFLRELHTRGMRVRLEAAPALAPLVEQLPWVDAVAPDAAALRPFDFEIPIMSLAFALGCRLANLPPQDPPLRAPAAHVERWRERLGPRRGLRVGLAWSGNPTHRNDAQRSIPLASWREVRGLDATFIALQKGIRESDLAALDAPSPILRFDDDIADLRDTAALAELVDVVVTVDTAVAHVAAAMGRPTWILLPFAADWRWMLERETSPWYPGVRLFRQPRPGEWASVMERVARELRFAAPGAPGVQ
jgi:tetratricopeptide (TPR) repeat protein